MPIDINQMAGQLTAFCHGRLQENAIIILCHEIAQDVANQAQIPMRSSWKVRR
jgi:hypothetical protein